MGISAILTEFNPGSTRYDTSRRGFQGKELGGTFAQILVKYCDLASDLVYFEEIDILLARTRIFKGKL